MTAAKQAPGHGLTPREFRDVLGAFPTGVTVMTTQHEDRLAGVTVSSFNTLSLDPPLVLWSLSLAAPSLPVFRAAGRFVVNILAEGQEAVALQFARGSDDKFRGIALADLECGLPAIAGAAAHVVCDIHGRAPGGDHEIFIGRVAQANHQPQPPIVFHRGRFGSFQAAS
ncbi:flavin reductase family protein [Paracoccus thiocyanatus]|nr:flavin reductase family protein [Paracoccus thiocyanatus]